MRRIGGNFVAVLEKAKFAGAEDDAIIAVNNL
jgi:hypothetical protein